MNALLRIQVQVAAREAQNSLRQLTTTINQVNRATSTVGRGGGGGTSSLASGAKSANRELTALGRLSQKINGDIDRSRMGMIQLGKNMQWVGRQINFNFTIPLLLAGRSALKWALENEQAATRVRKVYGESGKDYTVELKKVGTAVRMLSDYYGVNQAAVMELAAQWAAAGATGAALAESVKNSLDLSILGDYTDLGDIFTQLITIQTAYKLSSGQLKTAIADLNTTENMTAATLPDLVTGIAKAGSSAELAGVDFQHLAAFMAVLTPATGSAANAGNSLKTIFSRLAKPTKDTSDALKDMGINIGDASFQVLNGSQKLELMAVKFAGLTDAQKAFVASSIGARFQVNKFAEIMQSITDKAGTYQKVLAAIDPKNEPKNLAAANREIQILLQSDPRKLQILTNSIKNLLIDAITPAIPVIATILSYVQALFRWFGNLNPTVQKVAIGFLLLVAAVGIAAQMLGSFKLLFGTAIEFFIWAASLLPGVSLATEAAAATTTAAIGTNAVAMQAAAVATAAAGAEIVATVGATEAAVIAEAAVAEPAIAAAFAAPWILIGAAVAALLIVFRHQIADGIGKVIDFVKGGFNSLPQSIQNALLAVARVVSTIIKTIIHWLSYLNPFARHSPSLVDNVTAGVQAILAQYARLSNVGGIFARAASDLAAFTQATAAAVAAAKAADRADQRKSIVQTSPAAGPIVDQMFANLDSLKGTLGPLNDAINAQQKIVDSLRASYDLASAAVDHFEFSLKPLEATVSSLADQIDIAKQAIQDYASTNITGMRAANDAIFSNQMAQKALQLQLLQLGDAGQGFDDIRKKIDLLNGDIESIRATMTDLQQSGAGSDVLAVYQEQLNQLNAQKAGLDQAAQNGADLTKQLEDLQHAGQILDLQKSLNFDPLLKQIDELANAMPELPFDQIMAGIATQKSTLDQLTTSYDLNKAALDAQKVTLDQMIATRDTLKQSYDDENTSLGLLKDQYSAIEDQINAITDALNTAVAATKTLTPAAGGGGGGGGGGVPFEDLTGQFDPTTLSGDLGTMQETIDQWIADMKKQFAGIDINPFHWFTKAWDKLQTWWGNTALPWLQNLGSMVWGVISNINFPDLDIGGILGWFAGLGNKIGGFLSDTWNEIGPHITQFADLFSPLVEALDHIAHAIEITFKFISQHIVGAFNFLKPVFSAFYMFVVPIFSAIWNTILRVVSTVWDTIKTVIKGALDIIHGIIKGVLDLINGDWGKAWNDFTQILSGAWGIIWGIISGVIGLIVDVITGIVEAVVGMAGVILGIGESIVQGIWDGMVSIWNSIITWIAEAVMGFIRSVMGLFGIHSPSSVMMDIGIDIMTGMLNGLVQAAVAVWNWFIALPGVILGYLVDAATWLWTKGSAIASGIWNGIKEGAQDIWNWFVALPSVLAGYFSTAFLWLWNKAKGIASGIWNGIKEGAQDIWNWFTNLPSTILGYFLDAGTWLLDIGKKIIGGLLSGITDGFNKVKDFVGGIGSWIGDHKGPPAYDANLLVNNGQLIMQSLQTGLMRGWKDTESLLKGMTASFNDYFTGGGGFAVNLGTNLGSSVQQAAGNNGSRNFTFNGDLSFPNITDPADAEKFIQNLEVLAGTGGGL